MIATHLKPEWSERRIARISLVPALWDAPEPEPETPIGRTNDTPQISAIVAKPRPLPSPAKETFCAHDEDALRIAMQRQAARDGQAPRVPMSPPTQEKIGGRPRQYTTWRHVGPGKFLAFMRRRKEPIIIHELTAHFEISQSCASNVLAIMRKNGVVKYDHSARKWGLT